MQPIATDGVAWSVDVFVSVRVCLLVTFVSPSKTAEPNEMRSDLGGPKEPCIKFGSRSPQKWEIMEGWLAHWKALAVSAAVYAAKWISPATMTACSERVVQSWITAQRHAMRPFVKPLRPLVLFGLRLNFSAYATDFRFFCGRGKKLRLQ